MSTELWAVPQLSCSSILCLQQAVYPRLTSVLDSYRSYCASIGSHFAPGQLLRPPSSRFPWNKTFMRSDTLGLLSYRHQVLCLAGETDRLPCFGKYDAARVHTPMPLSPHGTKASIFVLPIFFRSLWVFSELCR